MKTHTETSKYKLLVLLDRSKNTSKTVEDAISLAKKIDGSIDIFQVSSPVNIAKNENQIATLRSMDMERYKQELALRDMVTNIRKETKLPVISNFTFGNVKNEIKNHIEKTQPDIVVLGKRRKKIGGLVGDSITKELLTFFPGTIYISGKEQGANISDNQSLGFLNSIDGIEKVALINDLKPHHKNPFKIFKTQSDNTIVNENSFSLKNNETKPEKNTIVYEFDASNNTIADVSNFISKNNLALLCMDKGSQNMSLKGKLDSLLTQTIDKINIPVLVLNTNIK